jgi:hypothetical protein
MLSERISRIDLRITPSRTQIYPAIENWFQNLQILVVTDIGDTRETEPFNEAIRLTTEILTRGQSALGAFQKLSRSEESK